LELGAGSGFFLDEARKASFDVYAVEPNLVLAGLLEEERKIPCCRVEIDDRVFDGKKFDIIYHCDVLSHFTDPIHTFREINKALKQDGYLIFETGNLAEVDSKYYRWIDKFYYPEHLFFFSHQSLQSLLELTGFKLIRIYSYSILYQLIAIRMLKRLSERKKKLKFASQIREGVARDGPSGLTQKPGPKNNVRRRGMTGYLMYFLRFKLGLLLQGKRRPQTLIVVAKK
jgi:SAM-dependent methyltransferase